MIRVILTYFKNLKHAETSFRNVLHNNGSLTFLREIRVRFETSTAFAALATGWRFSAFINGQNKFLT